MNYFELLKASERTKNISNTLKILIKLYIIIFNYSEEENSELKIDIIYVKFNWFNPLTYIMLFITTIIVFCCYGFSGLKELIQEVRCKNHHFTTMRK